MYTAAPGVEIQAVVNCVTPAIICAQVTVFLEGPHGVQWNYAHEVAVRDGTLYGVRLIDPLPTLPTTEPVTEHTEQDDFNGMARFLAGGLVPASETAAQVQAVEARLREMGLLPPMI